MLLHCIGLSLVQISTLSQSDKPALLVWGACRLYTVYGGHGQQETTCSRKGNRSLCFLFVDTMRGFGVEWSREPCQVQSFPTKRRGKSETVTTERRHQHLRCLDSGERMKPFFRRLCSRESTPELTFHYFSFASVVFVKRRNELLLAILTLFQSGPLPLKILFALFARTWQCKRLLRPEGKTDGSTSP